MDYRCIHCNRPYPETGIFYHCPQCGGIYDAFDWRFVPASSMAAPGIWRWQANFGLAQNALPLSLGEGNTPCVWSNLDGQEVAFKCEYQNPSGSYKDRGMAVLMSFLISRGARTALEDSSGNAGAAFAAYAGRAGLLGRVFVPAYASGPKRRQIEIYGAEVISVPGTRQDVALAARKAADEGQVYASHAHMPHVLAGYATLAYELVEQMGGAPGALVTPVGQGGLLLGIGRGFRSLLAAGRIDRMPVLVGVQAAACAPFLIPAGKIEQPGETLAEGVRIAEPLRLTAVKDVVAESNGFFLDVKEDQILPGLNRLARSGFFVEPTSALVWDALRQAHSQLPKPVAVVLTGSGLKWNG